MAGVVALHGALVGLFSGILSVPGRSVYDNNIMIVQAAKLDYRAPQTLYLIYNSSGTSKNPGMRMHQDLSMALLLLELESVDLKNYSLYM